MFRILLLDRSVNAVRALRDGLKREGFHVHGARSVNEALQVVGDGGCDAVIVDRRTWDRLSPLLEASGRAPDACVLLLIDDHEAGENHFHRPPGIHAVVPRATTLGDPAAAASHISQAIHDHRTMRRKQTMVRWLEREARTDHLTGLHNRHAFDEQLAVAVRECGDLGQPVTVVVLDVAGTRMVNDSHGPDAGDSMIRRAAAGVARCIRGIDFAARVGGDDFAVILPGGGLEVGRLVARRISQELDRLNASEWAGEIPVSVTFGVASGRNCTAAELFSAAEEQIDRRRSLRLPVHIYPRRTDPVGPSVA